VANVQLGVHPHRVGERASATFNSALSGFDFAKVISAISGTFYAPRHQSIIHAAFIVM
jgi:hypothetical protein